MNRYELSFYGNVVDDKMMGCRIQQSITFEVVYSKRTVIVKC